MTVSKHTSENVLKSVKGVYIYPLESRHEMQVMADKAMKITTAGMRSMDLIYKTKNSVL